LVAVVVGEGGEGGFGFPGHVGVGVAEAVFQDFHHAPACHVEVFPGIGAVGQAAADEGAREGGVDTLRGEHVQQLAEVGGLLLLVADVVANRAALGVAAYRQLAKDKLRPPDTGDLRDDVLTLLRRINCDLSSPNAEILRSLLASVNDEPELLAQLYEQAPTAEPASG